MKRFILLFCLLKLVYSQNITLAYGDKLVDGRGASGLKGGYYIAFSKDGKNVYVSASKDSAISWFTRNVQNGRLVYQGMIKNNSAILNLVGPRGIVISPDGRFLYVGANQSILWFSRNLSTGALSYISRLDDNVGGVDGLNFAHSVLMGSDGKQIYVAAYNDNSLAWFNRDSLTGSLSYQGILKNGSNGILGLKAAYATVLSPDSKQIYVAGNGDSAISWFGRSLPDGSPFYYDNLHNGLSHLHGLEGVFAIAISPDGRYLYAGSFYEKGLQYFSRNTFIGDLVPQGWWYDTTAGMDGLNRIRGILISPDGKYLYTSATSDSAIAWFSRDSLTGVISYQGKISDGMFGLGELSGVRAVNLSPDGRHIYAVSYDSNSIEWFKLNHTPQISSTTDSMLHFGNVGATYTDTVKASDLDSEDTVFFELLSPSPNAMQIDSVSGVLEWIPIVSQLGTNFVTILAKDRWHSFDTLQFQINITPSLILTEYDRSRMPEKFELNQNYPNPFSTKTMIGFAIPLGFKSWRGNRVSLKIFDVQGRLVRNIYEGNVTAGFYSVLFNGRAGNGKLMQSGIYCYRIKTDGFCASRRLLISR